MLSTEECTQILGEDKVSSITERLKSKNINQHTIQRVLDYLACHKGAFPNIDTKKLEENLINNLQKSIIETNPISHGFDYFKRTKDIKMSLKVVQRASGESTGSSIILVNRPKQFLKPKAYRERIKDSIIRHELDHLATTTNLQFKTKEEFAEYLKSNLETEERIFKCDADPDKKNMLKNDPQAVEELYASIGKSGLKQCGVHGSHHNEWVNFGDIALNEGITSYKQDRLDEFANKQKFQKSGYNLNRKVIQFMVKKIGEDKLIQMHMNNDFAGITTSFMEAIGKDEKYMDDFYKNLEIETNNIHLSIKDVLMGKFRKMLRNTIGENNKMLQGNSLLGYINETEQL